IFMLTLKLCTEYNISSKMYLTSIAHCYHVLLVTSY
ncbi:unnamed protein product, partial [Heterotrigona itama]